MFTFAATTEPHRGWGGPVAILIAVAAFIAFATLHDVWMRRRDLPSPTGEDDTDRDTTPWWGRIIERDGRRVRAAEPAGDADEDVESEPEEPATIEEVVGMMLDRGHPYAEIVRSIMEEFEVSEATAKRRIRDVRAERIAAAS